MKKFTIKTNEYLKENIQGFSHDRYQAGMNRHFYPGHIEHLICTFKNDKLQFSDEELMSVSIQLEKILLKELQIVYDKSNLTGQCSAFEKRFSKETIAFLRNCKVCC